MAINIEHPGTPALPRSDKRRIDWFERKFYVAYISGSSRLPTLLDRSLQRRRFFLVHQQHVAGLLDLTQETCLLVETGEPIDVDSMI